MTAEDKTDAAPETKPKRAKKANGKSEILLALHKVMSAVGYVRNTDRNEFHKYNYAGEGALLGALRPAMLDAGLILIPSVMSATPPDEYGNTDVKVEYTLAHISGEVWPEKIVAAGTGNDKNSKGGIGDKGVYKALTGANKYLLRRLFQIETGDDPERENSEPTPPDKPVMTGALGIAALRKAAKEFSVDLAACSDLDTLDALVGHSAEMLGQLKDDLPAWYGGDSKQPGAAAAINGKREELSAKECEDMGPGRDGPDFPGPPAPDETEAAE